MQVFISHSTPDDDVVTRIHDTLEAAEIDTWVDHIDIIGGDNWNQRIQETIQARKLCLFVLSPASAENENCAAEWWHYLNTDGRRLYVVLARPVAAAKFPWRLRVVQYVDLSKDFDTGIQTLIAAIKGKREIRKEDPGTALGIRLTGDLPRVQLDIPISGRTNDLNAIHRLMTEGARLVVIQGIGGMGKTRLAAELAITAEDFKDGVIWQTFIEYTKVDSLTARIREHLNLPAEYDTDMVWGALAEKQVLILLDNAESCTDKANYAHRLEGYALEGGTRIVMTSREQWRETRRFNRAYDLAVPDLDSSEKIVRDMAAQQGVDQQVAGQERLFSQKARRHPRLIQYALGWLHDYPLTRVFTMLDELKGGEDVQEALNDILHRTLRQVESTPNGPQAVADLHKLLVCHSGFTNDAAEAILGSVDNLSLLRRWNLIGFDGSRYSIDPLIDAVLEPDPSAYPAHFEYYQSLAKQYDITEDYAGLFPENDNLEIAFEWAMSKGEDEKAYWFYNTCRDFLFNWMLFERNQNWLERLTERLQAHPDASLISNIQNALGILYKNMPTGNTQNNLKRAIEHYKIAMEYWTPENVPLDYARTQNNLGNAYRNLAAMENHAENLRLSISCFEAALLYWTPENAPLDYAKTQNNLGNTYRNLAAIEDQAMNLKRAITCFETALLYWTPGVAPLGYAGTQNNLGIAYRNLAAIENPAMNLKRAIEYYQAALVYYTPQTTPAHYAGTQNNMGNAYRNLAIVEDPAINLKHAIECFEAALVYWTVQAVPMDHAMTQNNMGVAYANLAAVENRVENLKRAIACYEAALKIRTPETGPLDYAMTQQNLSVVYKDLGDTEKECASSGEAEKYYRLMGHVEIADKLKRGLEALGCNG